MIMIIILKRIIEEVEPEQIATLLSAAPQKFVNSSKNEGGRGRGGEREILTARLFPGGCTQCDRMGKSPSFSKFTVTAQEEALL